MLLQQVILLVVAEMIVRKITNDISAISSGVAESTVTYMTTADASSEKPKNQVMLLQTGLEMSNLPLDQLMSNHLTGLNPHFFLIPNILCS